MLPFASTMTAPTQGLGEANPPPWRARSSALCRNCSSVEWSGILYGDQENPPRRHGVTEKYGECNDSLQLAWRGGGSWIVLLRFFECDRTRFCFWPHSARHRNERKRVLGGIGWRLRAKKPAQ